MLAEVSLADLMKELNVKDAALFKEQNYEGEVTVQQFLRLGILHEDQLDAMKDDLAQTHSLSTSLKVAELQTRINSYAARVRRWQKLQATMMPKLALHMPSAPDPDDIIPTNVVSKIDRSAFHIKTYMPSSLDPELREQVCSDDLIEAEARLRYATALASIVEVRRMLKMKYSVGVWKSSKEGYPGYKAGTRSRESKKRYSRKARRDADRYRRNRQALINLDSEARPVANYEWADSNWKDMFKELKPADVRFMNVMVRDMADKTILLKRKKDKMAQMHSATGRSGQMKRGMSWIWTMGRASAEPVVTELALQEGIEMSRPEAYDIDNTTVRAEWAKAKARAERWNEELILVQMEMQRVVQFFTWKAGDWDNLSYQRKLDEEHEQLSRDQYRAGLAAYAARQADTYRRMAAHCAMEWRSHLIYYNLASVWTEKFCPMQPGEEKRLKKISNRHARNKELKVRRETLQDDLDDMDEAEDNLYEDMDDVPVERSIDRAM